MEKNRRPRHKLITSTAFFFLTKDPKTNNGEKNPLQQMFWENWLSTCRELKLDPSILPCINIISMGIKDLKVKPETLRQLQETVGDTLEHVSLGNYFQNRTRWLSIYDNEQMGMYQSKRLLQSYRNSQ
jgi:hypothetical protein